MILVTISVAALQAIAYSLVAISVPLISPLLLSEKDATVMVQRVSSVIRQTVQKLLEGDSSGESVVGLVTVLTHVITITRFGTPCIQWCLRMATIIRERCVFDKHNHRIRHCKLRMSAYTAVDSIVEHIQQQPGGYAFWASLPRKGRHNTDALRKTLTNILLDTLFTPAFLDMLLCSALTSDGRPIPDSPLYEWLVTHVYSGKVSRLYSDWLRINKQRVIDA